MEDNVTHETTAGLSLFPPGGEPQSPPNTYHALGRSWSRSLAVSQYTGGWPQLLRTILPTGGGGVLV